MCTLALYLRQFENYPLVIAANRDEHFSRATAAPQLWPTDPKIVAGKDLVAGGTWLGVNARGIAAGIVNRRIQLDAGTTPRSRGLLCLDMLEAASMADAQAALPYEDAGRYQAFLLLAVSAESAFAAYNGADIECRALAPGLHVFGNTSFTAEEGKKLDRARELFHNAAESLAGVLAESNLDSAVDILRAVLGDHTPVESADAKGALCVHAPDADYGTVSSSIVFLSGIDQKFYFYHAPGPPCRTDFQLAASLEVS
ncbi:MAG TPA: NRDE family protein [Candidatus Binatia bacterium]|jgi:uncharacterized protein with NRDE domain